MRTKTRTVVLVKDRETMRVFATVVMPKEALEQDGKWKVEDIIFREVDGVKEGSVSAESLKMKAGWKTSVYWVIEGVANLIHERFWRSRDSVRVVEIARMVQAEMDWDWRGQTEEEARDYVGWLKIQRSMEGGQLSDSEWDAIDLNRIPQLNKVYMRNMLTEAVKNLKIQDWDESGRREKIEVLCMLIVEFAVPST